MKSEKLFTDNNWNRKQHNDAFKCFADSLFFRRPTEGIVTPLVFLVFLPVSNIYFSKTKTQSA